SGLSRSMEEIPTGRETLQRIRRSGPRTDEQLRLRTGRESIWRLATARKYGKSAPSRRSRNPCTGRTTAQGYALSCRTPRCRNLPYGNSNSRAAQATCRSEYCLQGWDFTWRTIGRGRREPTNISLRAEAVVTAAKYEW